MPGPPPKPAAQRRRRNAAPPTTKLPPEGLRGRAPTLPGAQRMLPYTRRWWRTVWASPMAVAWLDADLPAIVRLAQLVDLTARQFEIVREGPKEITQGDPIVVDGELVVRIVFDSPVTPALLSEARQLEDRLGLSPLSRRRLQWEIDMAVATGETHEGKLLSADRWLRAVQ